MSPEILLEELGDYPVHREGDLFAPCIKWELNHNSWCASGVHVAYLVITYCVHSIGWFLTPERLPTKGRCELKRRVLKILSLRQANDVSLLADGDVVDPL